MFEAALSQQRLVKMTFASFRWSTASDWRLERSESKFKTTITICTFVNSGVNQLDRYTVEIMNKDVFRSFSVS